MNTPNDKLSFQNGAEEKMPAPEKSGSLKLIIFALLAVVTVGGAAYWLMQTPESKEEMRNHAADIVNNAVSETPLAGIGETLRVSPPPPPLSVTHPATAPGTLAGQNVTGTIGSPIDLESSSPNMAQEGGVVSNGLNFGSQSEQPVNNADNAANQAAFNQEALLGTGQNANENTAQFPENRITEDQEIPPKYVAELAQWLVKRYQPASRSLNVSIQNLNQFGGITIANQTKGGRAALLRYVFQPSMVKGLYELYVNRLMTDMDEYAQKRGLSQSQTKQFYMALAGKSVLWGTALEGILQVNDLKTRLNRIEDLAQKTVDINMQLTNSVFELDELRERKAAQTSIQAAQLRVDGITARYRRATEDHMNAQRALVNEIRKNTGQSLDSDTLLFLAAWIERRVQNNGEGRNAVQNCAAVLRDFGRRCAQIGTDSN